MEFKSDTDIQTVVQTLSSRRKDNTLTVDDLGMILQFMKEYSTIYIDQHKNILGEIRPQFNWTDAALEWLEREIS